jgi:gliding motility-associated-like protein
LGRLFFILSGIFCLFQISYSQHISITGESPNYYLKVNAVLSNGIKVSETTPGQLSQFTAGDKVIVIQMTGATVVSNPGFETNATQLKDSLRNTGKFEILQVDEIVKGADTTIYFTHDFSNKYNAGEKIQAVKIIEGETVTVTGTLSARSWDGNTGGILAILGIDTVKLDDNSVIDVSAKGFRGGAVPEDVYPEGVCRLDISATVKDTLYWRTTDLKRAGFKGEGIMTAAWPYTRGRAFNLNGGGSGSGLFSGGGGGSNYLGGGDGGQQSNYCTLPLSVKGGMGGFSCYEMYMDGLQPKVIFGGGGGSGSYKAGSTPSRGGNGGGIVIIITENLVSGTNAYIKANGENGTPLNTDGSGGGGGAGGAILLDANNIMGTAIRMQIKGGSGSSSSLSTPWCNGAGGSGSGGVFWYSGSRSPVVMLDSTGGSIGTACGPLSAAQYGSQGQKGLRIKDIVLPLTGFLFNSIRGIDTICNLQTPALITASKPKGGDGTYTWTWQQSTNKVVWNAASGAGDMMSFQPTALTQTTYYRRIVNSSNPVTYDLISDTSRIQEVFVYPSIGNNTILGTDTICYNLDARAVKGNISPLTGGNGSYSYIWQQSTDLAVWNNAGTSSSFDPALLTETTHYRRIVNSTAWCSDTSGHVTITVIPSITLNRFATADTSICENSAPGRIVLPTPAGGDETYSYQWQSDNGTTWQPIPLTSDSISYTPGILTDTMSYRRIVYSGNDNACIDTSNARNIIIRPLISNNAVKGSTIQYTCYNSPIELKGSDPANGFGPGTYAYTWEVSDDNLNWQSINPSANKDLQTTALTETSYFRRTVYSGQTYHECTDVSDPVEVRINPLPTANVKTTFDTICAGSAMYVKFDVSGNGPFSVSITGAGQTVSGINIAGPLDSLAFHPALTSDYVMISVEDDSSCTADASGFIPASPGTVYAIPVANAGEDDEICSNTINLAAVKTNPAYHGLWTATGCTFTNDTLAGTAVTVDNYGENTFTWTESNWHCTTQDYVNVTFWENPQVPDAGPDQDLQFVYETQLSATAPSVGEGKWSILSGSATFDNDTRPDAAVSGLSDQAKLKWTVTNGICPAESDSLKVTISPLKIPQGFTPNNDGKNDYFDLGADHAENIKIKIFNSAGVLVYASEDYCPDNCQSGDNTWIGENMNGVKLPQGTYFYVVEIKVAGKEQVLQYRSFVELMW